MMAFVIAFDSFVCGMNFAITLYEIDKSQKLPWTNMFVTVVSGLIVVYMVSYHV